MVFYLITYQIDHALMISSWIFWSRYVFILPFIVLAAMQTDLDLPPSPLRRRIRAGFLVAVISNAIFFIFFQVMVTKINPGLIDMQLQTALDLGHTDMTREMFKPSIGKTLFSFGRSLIGSFLLAYAVAFILERKS